jgi:hypothetical protein
MPGDSTVCMIAQESASAIVRLVSTLRSEMFALRPVG